MTAPERLTVAEYNRLTNAEKLYIYHHCRSHQIDSMRQRRCFIKIIDSKVDGMSIYFGIDRWTVREQMGKK